MIKELVLIFALDFECKPHIPPGCTGDSPCFKSEPMWEYMWTDFDKTERELTVSFKSTKSKTSWRGWCAKLKNLKVTRQTEEIPEIEKRNALCRIGCGP